MKKNLLITFLFLSAMCSAQEKSPFAVYIGCYTGGDTIPDNAFGTAVNLGLLKDGKPQNEACLNSWNISVTLQMGLDLLLGGQCGSVSLSGEQFSTLFSPADQAPKYFILKNIVISIKQNDKIIKQKLPPQKFYRSKAAYKKCPENISYFSFTGKLFTGKKNRVPLVNQKIILKNEKNLVMQSTVTDNGGNFSFQNIKTTKIYRLEITGSEHVKESTVLLGKPDNTVIRTFNITGDLFLSELLPIELITPSAQKPDEGKHLLQKMCACVSAKDSTIIKNIDYKTNSAEIKTESLKMLDEIVAYLVSNPNLKLTINSFTDSRGDDASNLALSQKRADKVLEYFISKGIQKERLTAKGLGETQMLNRCTNGVECSEKEHQVNRRTEFKVTR
jgi:outer membrane protein OmpA-like peptidoglycan-associated protein